MAAVSRAVQGWRAAHKCLQEVARPSVARGMSGAATSSSRPTQQTAAEAATTARLFEKVQPVEQVVPPETTASDGGQSSPVLRALSKTLFWGTVAAAGYFGYYTYRYSSEQVAEVIEETKQAKDEFPGNEMWTQLMSWYLDKRRWVENEIKKYSDPPSDRLLPDLPPHARHVRTLVMDLDDLLVHSEWTRARGWRTFKRPGVEDFLRQMSQCYELVVYTDQLPTYADPILDRLDPQRFIQYRLYRDSTQYTGGRHVRDLSKLNRDPAHVLMLTSNPSSAVLQPDNTVQLKAWKMEADDTTLLDMIPFLEAVVRTGVSDTRDVVRSYSGADDIPTAFRERMKRLAETQRLRAQQPKGFFSGLAHRS